MQEGSHLYHNSTIHYKFTKAGPRLLVCWHGYDENSAAFEFLENELPGFSLLCIDLPFHGKTEWRESYAIGTGDLHEIISQLRKKEFPGIESYSLLGFSLGGRIALAVFQLGADSIDRMVLLAPDGINTNFWHWLATRTAIGNRIFRYAVSSPGWIFTLLKIGNKIGLINQSVYKFTRFYLQDQKSREHLYKRWRCMRRINPDRTQIKQAALKQNLVLHLVYGEYDRIIKHERAAEFCRDLKSNCQLHILSCGHQVLQDKNAAFIATLFRD